MDTPGLIDATRLERLERSFATHEQHVASAIVALDDGTPERLDLIHKLAGSLGLISGEITLAKRDAKRAA